MNELSNFNSNINKDPISNNNNQANVILDKEQYQIFQNDITQKQSEQNISTGYSVDNIPSYQIDNPFKNIEDKLNLVYISDSDEEQYNYGDEKMKVDYMYNEEDGEEAGSYIATKNEKMECDEPIIKQIDSKSNIVKLGYIETIVEGMILVKPSINNIVNLDSTCYNKSLNPVCFIFDVIGQIDDPLYVLKAFSTTQAECDMLKENDDIIIDLSFSQIVNAKDLIKNKGTDASNAFDEEIDDHDYSDDEEEARIKKSKKKFKEDAQLKNNNLNNYQYNQSNMQLRPDRIDPFAMFTNK